MNIVSQSHRHGITALDREVLAIVVYLVEDILGILSSGAETHSRDLAEDQ